MTPGVRRFALTAHVVSSVGWLGAAVAYLALVVAALLGDDAETVRAVSIAIEPITWFAIVPLAAAALLTGLVQGLGTQWGLVRHYWVLIKFVLSVLASVVLLLNTRTVGDLAARAATTKSAHVGRLEGQLLHAGGGLAVLLVTTSLAVFKPRGLTPFGRRQHDRYRRVFRSS